MNCGRHALVSVMLTLGCLPGPVPGPPDVGDSGGTDTAGLPDESLTDGDFVPDGVLVRRLWFGFQGDLVGTYGDDGDVGPLVELMLLNGDYIADPATGGSCLWRGELVAPRVVQDVGFEGLLNVVAGLKLRDTDCAGLDVETWGDPTGTVALEAREIGLVVQPMNAEVSDNIDQHYQAAGADWGPLAASSVRIFASWMAPGAPPDAPQMVAYGLVAEIDADAQLVQDSDGQPVWVDAEPFPDAGVMLGFGFRVLAVSSVLEDDARR